MMRRRYCYSILVLLLAVFLCHPAFAAKCVKPNGAGGCYAIIQEAIDNVAEGGTIEVFPGIYYEYITANKPGITILGMGNKRTDVRINPLQSGSNTISASNVTIKNLTIQNGQNGIYLSGAGANSKIINVNIISSVDHSIFAQDQDDVLIKNCQLLFSGRSGIYFPLSIGERLTVKNTVISDCGEDGIYSRGDRLTVEDCTIKNSGFHLMNVQGQHLTIHNNQLFKAGELGIYANSNFAKITENTVRLTGYTGIFINGEAPVVKKNTVMYSLIHGFSLTITGGEAKVVSNKSGYNSMNGFNCDFNSSSTVVLKNNKAFNNDGIGFDFVGIGDKTIEENLSTYNALYGFSVSQPGGTFRNNTASKNGDSGYWFNTDCIAIQNKAFNNMTAGFYVQGYSNLLRNNRANGNLSHGIYLNSINNNIINNTMLDNHLDKCDEGTNNTWINNTYDTECP